MKRQALIGALVAAFLAGTPPAKAQGIWTEEALLQAPDAYTGDFFGWSVALSGDTAVVGAHQDDDAGSASGAAYVFVRSGSSWLLEQKLTASDPNPLDRFGYSVAVDGDTIVVGALEGEFIASDTGCAYVFVRVAGVWSQEAQLVAADRAWGDEFGVSVAVQGDTAVLGASKDDDAGPDSGSAYVFVRSGVIWSQQAKLTAGDASGGDHFGSSVALDGETAAIGADYDDAPKTDSGSVYVFVRGAATWSEEQKLTAGDAPVTAYLGCSVALDGERVVAGAWGDDTYGTSTGAAYVYERAGGVWSEAAKLTVAGLADFDGLGRSVSLDGSVLAIGAPYEDVDGDSLAGTVYVFETDGSSWSQWQRVVASNSAPDMKFGWSVSLDGTTNLAGAPEEDSLGFNAGAAYVQVVAPVATSYCTSGTSASGCQAWLASTGLPSASAASGFVVTALDVEAGKTGIFFYGFQGPMASPWGGGSTSWRCVLPPVLRSPKLPGTGQLGTCQGRFDRDFNAFWATANPLKVPPVGQQVWMQCWYRDPLNPIGLSTSLTDALTFTEAP